VNWLADENFNNDILRGIRRRAGDFDVVRVQDVPEISGSGDIVVLRWAAANERTLLTHDVSTMAPAMNEHRRQVGLLPAIVMVPRTMPIGMAIEEVLLLDTASVGDDWAAGVLYLPLR
jgi:hypothetical protein